ncbi:hypothetical protein J6A31_04510 [bacterium]|nr:hypothetical protein [bacterium]
MNKARYYEIKFYHDNPYSEVKKCSYCIKAEITPNALSKELAFIFLFGSNPSPKHLELINNYTTLNEISEAEANARFNMNAYTTRVETLYGVYYVKPEVPDDMPASKKTVVVLPFDYENKSEPFTYTAKTLDGKQVIGNVIVEKPWFSHCNNHKYYIVENQYSESGFCGGREFTGFIKTEVKPDTIEPYTQINKVRNLLNDDFIVELVEIGTDKIVARIESIDNIPTEIWKPEI